MASLAGLLKQRGFKVTGSDAAAYPPMSDFLASINIPILQPYAEANLKPRPDMVIVGNAISRGNPELEYVLDERIFLPFHAGHSLRSFSAQPSAAGDCRHARQDHYHFNAGVDFSVSRAKIHLF